MNSILIQLFLLYLIHPVSMDQSRAHSAFRSGRSAYDLDPTNHQQKPDLLARHEKNYTYLNCTIKTPRPNTEVFVNCPAFGKTTVPTICFHGCQPTKACGKSSGLDENCVPNEKTVFCRKNHSPNGTIIVQLRIDRSDQRLAGTWWCSHGELESAKFEIGLEKTVNMGITKSADLSNRDSKTPEGPAMQELRGTGSDRLDDRPLAYMRKPEVVLTVLTILGISLLINIAFCVRCLMLRLYLDASNEGSPNAACLGRCLCVPKNQRKASALKMTPMLPRSINWGDASNPNGSYHGSAHMFYPSPNMSKMPLLMGQQSLNDVSGMHYYPSGSLSGTLRRHGPASIPVGATTSSVGPLDVNFNQPLIYQSSVEHGGIMPQSPGYHGNQEVNMFANYMPSYVRVPSINAPSPNPSQRIMAINNATSVYHSHNPIPSGPFTPLNIATPTSTHYMMRMPPTIIYDDVAAGTSSMTGNYSRSPNGSVRENPPVVHHHHHAPLNQVARIHAVHDPNPLIPTESHTSRMNGNFPFPQTSCAPQSTGMTEDSSVRSHADPNGSHLITGTKVEVQPRTVHSSISQAGSQLSTTRENRSTILPVNGVMQ